MLAAALLGGCGGGADERRPTATSVATPTSVGATTGASVKVADILLQAAAGVDAARARGPSDLARLSNDVVHVRSDGAIEVALHAGAAVVPAELAELGRLGGEVVVSATTPSVPGSGAGAVVQAWVPADRLTDVASLAWVASVTPPSYGRAGG